MEVVKYHLYKYDYKKGIYEKLPTQIVYTVDPNETYAVRTKGKNWVFIEIPTRNNTLTTRDIYMFMIGRRSMDNHLIENLCKDIIKI